MEDLMIIFSVVALLSILGISLATSFNKIITTLFIVWAIIGGIAGYFGFYENITAIPPRFIFLILPASIIVIYSIRSIDLGKVKVSWLLGIHILRLPVELILFRLYLHEMIPESMTYDGWNWDIMSGISAIFLLVFYRLGRLNFFVLRAWNWLALGLLLIIIVTAVFSAPSPFQQLAFEQPNLAVLRFPFNWLPSVVVPIVLLSHLLIFQLLKQVNHHNLLHFSQRKS